ncbi:MAG: hypothetical protein ACR2FU_24785 [Streptosporangiaceae bacterium]
MQRRWSFNKRSHWAVVSAPILAMASLSVAAAGPAQAHSAPAAAKVLIPNKTNNLDCNAWSPKYRSVDPAHRGLCTDPHGPLRTRYGASGNATRKVWSRFVDNGHYVGHDEPSVKFISSAAGSGNTMTYFMRLPKDPAKKPTNSGSVVDAAELSPAIWFGLPMCDPHSYPQNPCTPDSDSNSGGISDPNAAGSAFMELQFYAPGFTGPDEPGCLRTKWCSALNIDSVESQFNFVNINPNCQEPVNFAFLQRNGVPAGPPSPQKANIKTNTPNGQTLTMNPGDVLKVAITDPAAGFTTRITDLTTHQSGFMVASAHNGFADTNYKDCSGFPHTFHAEYSTASQQNQVPWAALEGGVLMQEEIGHAETCASLTHKDAFNAPGFFIDTHVFDTCVGGTEGRVHHHNRVGEGSCNPQTGVCKGAETEGTRGPQACPSNNFASGQLCEYADGYCVPAGTRTVTVGHHRAREVSPVNFCGDNRFQNGDLDFEGIDYRATSWPDGSPNVPTSARFAGPFTASGATYPQIQFETDAPGSEFLCNFATQFNCVVPPLGAKFYPFWTLTNKKGQGVGHGLFKTGACTWNFGNVIPKVTTRTFGKDVQYGSADFARYGGTAASGIQSNPEVTGKCPGLTAPSSLW